jgi:hypothetical protein
VLLTNVIVIQNNGVSSKEMCDTNKNVTKMGVIIKGIYFITHNLKFFGFFNKYQCEYIFEYLRII